MNTKTFAVKDAPAADGRFPVIIYHPGLGGTFEDNSVLFEYLASHGYVVLSSAYPAADASILNINWDLARSFRDMEYLTHFAQRLPFANVANLAAMGHSYGAQAALAWHTEPNSALSAIVSIDSTTENLGRDHPGFAKFYQHFEEGKLNFRGPTLRFASRENKPKFENLEPYIKFAPRYEATVGSLQHNDYLTHGAVRPALLPENWPDAKKGQALRQSYDRVCQYILQFFDAYLKQSDAAKALLAKSLRDEGLDREFAIKFKSPVPAPPSARQLLLILKNRGAAKAAELLQNCRNDVNTNGLFGGLRFSVIDFDNRVIVDANLMQEALKLFNLSEQIFPKSAALHFHLGKAREATGDRDGAIAAYQKGLELVTSGGSDEKEKAPGKSDFEANLKRLQKDRLPRDDK